MRNLRELEQFRRLDWELKAHGIVGDHGNGAFVIPGEPDINVIASNGDNWDHLSVTITPALDVAHRCPTWEEMETVRKLFTKPNEVWVQFGVPSREHISFHPYCLHWWRHHTREVRLPPSYMVGPRR